MAAVGFTAAEQTHLYRVVAAVMLLGEVTFVRTLDGASGDEVAAFSAPEQVRRAAVTLAVPAEAVAAVLLRRTVSAGGGGEAYQVPLKLEQVTPRSMLVLVLALGALLSELCRLQLRCVWQANRARDGAAMGLYSQLFARLVGWLNRRTAPRGAADKLMTSIGVRPLPCAAPHGRP